MHTSSYGVIFRGLEMGVGTLLLLSYTVKSRMHASQVTYRKPNFGTRLSLIKAWVTRRNHPI